MPAQIMYELEHGVVRITLSRPEKRNALSLRMVEDLSGALDRASNERNARALVLTAVGTAFCAGMDLKDVRLDEDDQASQFAATLAAVYRKLLTFPLVTLCAVDGRAVGGGVGIACAADMLWAGSAASFSLPETRIGVVPALVSVVLRRRLPPIRLSGLLMTGRVLDPAQAVGVGLADVVAENSAHAEAKQYAHRLVRENSGEAMLSTPARHDEGSQHFASVSHSPGTMTWRLAPRESIEPSSSSESRCRCAPRGAAPQL